MLEAAQPPSAIVYARDSLALAALGVARKLRVDVPGDVSIAGFDDSPVAALSSPTLTTVHVDYTGLGQAAAEMLLAELDGVEPSRVGPAPTDVMVRASSGPPPLTQ
jgi:DNA-binding LacI/PurR family transcriptional regulator